MNKKNDKLVAGGAAAGTVAATPIAVSTVGVVGGLSGSGITSGLAAIGAGSMLGGIVLVAVAPLAVAGVTYGAIKLARNIF